MRAVPRSAVLALLVCLLPAPVRSQAGLPSDVTRRLAESGAPVKVWVFFADKGPDGANEAASDAARARLSERALARRAARRSSPGLVSAADVPVSAEYVAAVRAAGARVVIESRWLNAVSAVGDAGTLAAVAALPCVERLALVGRSTGPSFVGTPTRVPAPAPAGAQAGSSFYGWAQEQSDLIALPALHALGYTGEGAVVGVLDTGFRTTHAAFHTPGHEISVLAAYDFVDDDANVGQEAGDDPSQHHHGTIILGTLAAYLPGSLVGAAHDASFVLAKTEDVTDEYQAEEDYYVAGLEFVEANGADVATSSLGYIDWYTQGDLDGQTAVTTIAVNQATANGMHCCTAAGNAGHDGDPATSALIAPADALEVITVGATVPTGEVASFSSDGPTADGRVKPEILASGDPAYSVWPDDDSSYVVASGTSLATPQVAGVVACLVQAHPEWPVTDMRAQLFHYGSYFGAPLPDPLFTHGYGILDALAALDVGSWLDLGGGSPGASGVPQLLGTGNLTGGSILALTLTSTPANALVLLWIATTSSPFAALGGTVYAHPFAAELLLASNGAGVLSGAAIWPSGLPAGTEAWFQFLVHDPTVPGEILLSDAVRATTP